MRKQFGHPKLTAKTYHRGLSELTRRDSDLAEAVSRWGNPPFWTHTAGFAGIVFAILSQQVSLESARATFTKLENAIGSIHPEKLLSLDDNTLRAAGFSRQKTSYIRGVSHEIMAGELDLEELESMDNDQARRRLMQVKGIGAWTADTYLLFALRRSDAWPSGDLALAKAIQELRGLITIPSFEEVDRIADHWRPWRAVAARILWYHYLNQRGRTSLS
jgi:DNA-3-methyladenine glycosylase II